MMDGYPVYFLLIYFFWNVVAAEGQVNENAVCDKLNKLNAIWTCRKIPDCPFAKEILKSKQEVKCGFDNRVQKICCPQQRTTTSAPVTPITVRTTGPTKMPTGAPSVKDPAKVVWERCVEYAKHRFRNVSKGGYILGQKEEYMEELDCISVPEILITGGVRAADKEFPHMALIGYREREDQILWSCGGSLISDQFILSAGHCNRAGVEGEAKWALLGTTERLSTTSNGKRPGLFRIIDRFVHPGYKPPQVDNDLVLFKLQYPVKLSTTIRPICLFTSSTIPPILKNQSYVTGWGRTAADEDLSDFLLKAVINFQPDDDCKKAYSSDQNLKAGFDFKTMICAGDRYTGKDTCSGDSGGPLQVPITGFPCMWSLVGITSYGPTFCGSKKQPIPAIYTKVSNYIEWIQKVVWP